MHRLVILGNSGSGKSHLAGALATALGLPLVALDSLFWEPGGFSRKRPREQVDADIARLASTPAWIVEGVFGELAEPFLAHADTLVWLDLPWAVCRESLLTRGYRRAITPSFGEAEAAASFEKLLAWAEAYEARDDLRSRAGHGRLFASFGGGARHRFVERASVEAWCAQALRSHSRPKTS